MYTSRMLFGRILYFGSMYKRALPCRGRTEGRGPNQYQKATTNTSVDSAARVVRRSSSFILQGPSSARASRVRCPNAATLNAVRCRKIAVQGRQNNSGEHFLAVALWCPPFAI